MDQTNTDSAAAPAPRRPQMSPMCVACSKAPPVVELVKGHDDRCTTCFLAFCEGFTMHGEWNDFVSSLTDDPDLKAQFEEALRVRADPTQAIFVFDLGDQMGLPFPVFQASTKCILVFGQVCI